MKNRILVCALAGFVAFNVSCKKESVDNTQVSSRGKLSAENALKVGVGIVLILGGLALQPAIDANYNNLPKVTEAQSLAYFQRGELPNQKLSLDERFSPLATFKIAPQLTKLDLKGPNGKVFGTIAAPVFSISNTMQIYDVNGGLISESQEALVSWGNKIEVFAGPNRENKLGEIRERILDNTFSQLLSVP